MFRKTAALTLLLALNIGFLLAPLQAQSTPGGERVWPPGQWSMFQNTPDHRGATPFVGPGSPNLVWRYPATTNYGGAVVARDGTAYIGTLDGRFLALNPDGTLKWSVATPYTFETTPAILPDGRIAVVNGHGTLLVFNPDGSRSWQFDTGVPCACDQTSPVVDREGNIYFADGQFGLYALGSGGNLLWTHTSDTQNGGPPAVRSDGVILLPAGAMYALNPDGTLRWKSVDFTPHGSPAIAPDGTIYSNILAPPIMFALRPNGGIKWTYRVRHWLAPDVACSPAVGPDGTVYVLETLNAGGAVPDGLLLALNPDGSLKWQTHVGDYATSVVVDGAGTIYVGSSRDVGVAAAVFALNPDGTIKWEFDDSGNGDVRTPVAIGNGQRVYAGDQEAFFAIGNGQRVYAGDQEAFFAIGP